MGKVIVCTNEYAGIGCADGFVAKAEFSLK
jgi:hypothetical protein